MIWKQIELNRLGSKTFFLLLLRWSGIFVSVVISFVAMLSYLYYSPVTYRIDQSDVILVGGPLLVISFLLTLFLAWLEYRHYAIKLTEDSLEVRRGMLSISLNGVSYHRIRDIVTYRSFFERILGASTLVINLVGDADQISESYPMTIRLFALDRGTADMIHDELLKRIDSGSPF